MKPPGRSDLNGDRLGQRISDLLSQWFGRGPPGPPALMPHQHEAVVAITSSELQHRYLADEQGLGKTATALAALLIWQPKITVAICPTSAVAVWRQETLRFMPGTQVFVARQPRELGRVARLADPGRPCLILVTYSALSRAPSGWLFELSRLDIDVLICDEAHRLKSQNARRTQLVFGPRYDGVGGVIERVKHVLLLSGTPMTAYLADLWAPLHALWPERLWLNHEFRVPMTYIQFVDRFCTTKVNEWGQQVTGNKNVPELRQRLAGKGANQNVVIRRTKDILDLPEVRLVTTPLDVILPVGWNRTGPDIPEDDDAFETWVETAAHASIRQRLAEIKLLAAITFITDWLTDNPDDKLIVFAVHRAILDVINVQLAALGHWPVLLTGDTPERQRGAMVQQFQTQRACRVFIGQLQAAGEAITLHAASTVIFVETDWSATAIAQALSRAHRIGQRNRVLGHLLIVPNSFDEKVHQVCLRKALGAAALWGDKDYAVPTDAPRGNHSRPGARAALAGSTVHRHS